MPSARIAPGLNQRRSIERGPRPGPDAEGPTDRPQQRASVAWWLEPTESLKADPRCCIGQELRSGEVLGERERMREFEVRLHDVEAAMKRTKDQGHKAAAILSNVEQAMHSGFTLVCMWHMSPEHCRHLSNVGPETDFPLAIADTMSRVSLLSLWSPNQASVPLVVAHVPPPPCHLIPHC